MVLLRTKLSLVAVAAAAIALPAWAVGPPTWSFPAGRTLPVADSTTNHVISVGVPIPPGGGAPPLPPPGGAPTGFAPYTCQMGNRTAGLGAPWCSSTGDPNYAYTPADLSSYGFDPGLAGAAAAAARAGLTHAIVSGTFCTSWDAQAGVCSTSANFAYVIEPSGTLTSLVPIFTFAAGNHPAFTQAYLNSRYMLPVPAGDMSWGIDAVSAPTPICQAEGYTNYVPGSVTSTYKGSGCSPNEHLTKHGGSGWYNDSACYNYILTGLSCY